jgi:hypothetical protein
MKKIFAVVFFVVSIAPSLCAQTKPPAGNKVWRTPWGDPDLQGSWSNATTTPLQRQNTKVESF